MHRHFLLHKPHGYLSQFIYEKKRHKKLLGELHAFPEGTMAIGRLDEDSEGLLLLTTDGMMSEIVRSKTVEKEYFAQVDGLVTEEAIAQLKNGVEIGFKGIRYTTKKCEARIVTDLPDCIGEGRRIRDARHGPTSWLSITLTEGKFRQVRKMTAAVGLPTLRLVRIRVGTITLQNLKAGEVLEVPDFQTDDI
ncbi:23S rRNA pseudouridine2457 synthase [Flavobacterium cauense R2A-7]|uniref:Pseudouridine synthase n=1 Tax=Flavobacterium cauense R2A-7 TaxID=1341154 RepID=A0A562LNM4_9FLAO|nr:pseudouridine synthase [Flavobacterium cauense]KGO79815.1 pseudouridine synthase [Flavobacterium cauense R2A-7]TWI09221.1 23S rRNA pseudouridine2457 synthase [Flavobacterium cauense R2A-7]